MALTRRQKQVLDFIADFVEQNGYSPSYEEIAKGLNLASLATVHKHISALEAKQYVRRGHNQSRSLDVSEDYRRQRRPLPQPVSPSVPLLGRIAAGLPVESVAGVEVLEFEQFTGRGETFALQVKGDSMVEDHICSGDYVLVERTSEVRDGEIIVALVDGLETTLKRFYREGKAIARLQPANAAMEPIRVSMESVKIQGKVLAVLRRFPR